MTHSTRSTKRTSPVSAAPEEADPTTPSSGRKVTKKEAREAAKRRARIDMGFSPSKTKPAITVTNTLTIQAILKMTCPNLRDACTEAGLDTTGKKDELQHRLVMHVQAQVGDNNGNTEKVTKELSIVPVTAKHGPAHDGEMIENHLPIEGRDLKLSIALKLLLMIFVVAVVTFFAAITSNVDCNDAPKASIGLLIMVLAMVICDTVSSIPLSVWIFPASAIAFTAALLSDNSEFAQCSLFVLLASGVVDTVQGIAMLFIWFFLAAFSSDDEGMDDEWHEGDDGEVSEAEWNMELEDGEDDDMNDA